ncbi:response regulator transcription factor [Halorarius halobius]|uniref:response regulator transcription factor n=1 Tax=Halorarius halobius TaxID=2962671 RepID=UPI0020CCC15C|nr:response regulator [Halorarius halobius]
MGEQATVLVVEDEEALVEIYTHWLTEEYEVRTANGGEEALERLDGSVDVVLLDRLMPGMTGEEVLGRIRGRTSECRVAMVTAVEPDFDILEMGFDDYLTKPVGHEQLLETVEGLLERGTHAELERELYALASKRAALQSSKSPAELNDSEEFEELERRMGDIRKELETSMSSMDDGEFVAMVREIEDEASRRGSE